MAPRRDANEAIGTINLEPQAAPVDTFVKAPREENPGGGLTQLAEGLKGVSKELDAYFQQEQQRKNQEDALLGEAEFHKQNGKGYAEAVAEGSIPPQASRAFMEGYKRAQGTVAGQDLANKFNMAYEGWDGKNDPDPQAYNQFVQKFLRDNIGATTDPGVLAGLMPQVRQMAANGMARHTADSAKYLKETRAEAATAITNQSLDTARADALKSGPDGKPQGFNYDKLFADQEKRREEWVSTGGKAEDFDNRMIQDVAAAAMRWQDPLIIDRFMERTVPGKTIKYKDTETGRDVRQKTLDALDAIRRRNVTEARTEANERRKLETEEWSRKTINSILQNPAAPIPDELLDGGSRVDGDFKVKALGWQKSILAARGESDPVAMTDMLSQIYAGGGQSVVSRGLDNGSIRSASDLRQLQEAVEKVDKHKDQLGGILNGDTAKTIVATIKQRTMSKLDAGNLFAPEGMSDQGLRLRAAFNQQVLEWIDKNPKASFIEREKAVSDIGASILGRIQNEAMQPTTIKPGTPETPMDQLPQSGDTGTAPAALERRGQQQVPPSPQEQQPGAAPQQPQSPAHGQRGDLIDGQAARNWYAALPRETQQRVVDASMNTGVSMRDLVTKLYSDATKRYGPTGNPQQGAGASVSPIGYAPATDAVTDDTNAPVQQQDLDRISDQFSSLLDRAYTDNEPKGNYALSTITGDKQVNRILDFIGVTEAKGNYNAYFANANSTKDLSKLSLAQILQWQDARVRSGSKSSATGRYQFMRKTLRGLINRMGLSMDEKFTPELQDRMALQLLKDRGLDRWRAGKMSTKAFANNLALEWASLPNFTTGKSAYHGDGLNKSLTGVSNVLTALGAPDEVKSVANRAIDAVMSGPGPNSIYANIPADEHSQFMQWNNDPVGNEKQTLGGVKPQFSQLVEQVRKDNPGLQFVVASGHRDDEQQAKAIKWGWSRIKDSKHKHGNAIDVWPLDAQGRVIFDTALQDKLGDAMERAAKKLGFKGTWGGRFTNKDRPHFEIHFEGDGHDHTTDA